MLVLCVPSGEVCSCLEIRIVGFSSIGEEVRILLPLALIESLTLMSVETAIVLSKLGYIICTIVIKSSETILLMIASSITCIVTLVLLESTIGILRTWNVVSSEFVITSTKLIKALSIKVETLRIEEVSIRQNVEIVSVILAWSVFDLLARIFLDSGHRLQLRVDWVWLLVQHHDIFLAGSITAIGLLW